MTAAMRARDELRRDTLRMALAAAHNAEVAARRPLSDEELVGILTHEVKARREAIEAYTRAGRTDLARKEETEAAILGEFLPRPLDAAELDALVEAAIEEVEATSPRDLGRVMRILAPRTRGRADGRQVSERVAAALARRQAAGAGGGGAAS